jgi:hypothetical protein
MTFHRGNKRGFVVVGEEHSRTLLEVCLDDR